MRFKKLTADKISKWLPTRKKTDNKSHGGRVLIWAGSHEMPGAGILAAEAAGRAGAGYVYVSEKSIVQKRPETLLWDKKNFDPFQSVLVGPGLHPENISLPLFKKLKQSPCSVIIDAGALTFAAQKKFYPLPKHWIATPHAGELSRFLGINADQINADRLKAARAAQKMLGCSVLLKGYRTILAFENISVLIPTGNVALAKGGSGDVLAGFIAGLSAQNLSPAKAALVASYIHGWIADEWVHNKKDYLSLLPTDLLKAWPSALYRIRRLKTKPKTQTQSKPSAKPSQPQHLKIFSEKSK